MPYIDQKSRKKFKIGGIVPEDFAVLCESSGELNYLITLLLVEYARVRPDSYDTYNSIVGVLDCAKDEFKRRVLSNYEDLKIELNGDVYK